MKPGFCNTRLWQTSLAQQPDDPADEAREKLRVEFFKFRDRAATLTGEIARDLPEFTVHDITHLDALWEMADKIAGAHINLTPAEAFVLGGAFLIHDAGMGLAAYPEGREGLRRDQNWRDILTAKSKRRLGRTPTDDELLNPERDIELDVLAELLRLRHADRAAELASISWESPDGRSTYYLIENPELRKSYGEVIGRIAHSHWWDIEEVRTNFGYLQPLGAPATIGCPSDWTVDHLKLACLLRTADAIHLDARRAPGFLRALRKPSGYADLHWIFQERIQKPFVDGERLVFTCGKDFEIDEADAWWVGYELIQNADRELRQTDLLLQDLKRGYRFAARSVTNVEAPARLALDIRTKGWLPVDAHIKVSKVAALVRNLGGEQLYGRDQTVPLRELIQNASDAIRARRLLQNKAASWGKIVVRTGEDESGHWIEVEDNGIGMSTTVLTGPLLDFGSSFWGTEMMRQELPGLEGKGFESTGRYGIGFFSVFMWGERVQVTTQRYRDAPNDTQVLKFKGGLELRPLLRRAREAEHLEDGGGTRVRVWLKHPLEALFSDRWRHGQPTLENFCVWLCPALDANLFVDRSAGQTTQVIAASDWKTMAGDALCHRLWIHCEDRYGDALFSEQLKAAKNYRPLKDFSGEIVGRASLTLNVFRGSAGVITIGGFRTSDISFVAGILVGNPTRAVRDVAIPKVPAEEFQRWASEQAAVGRSLYDDPSPSALHEFAGCVRHCGGDTGDLPIAAYDSDWWTFPRIAGKKDWPEEIVLVRLPLRADGTGFAIELTSLPRVMGVNILSRGGGGPGAEWWLPEWSPQPAVMQDVGLEPSFYYTLEMAVIEALAKAWDASPEEVLRVSWFRHRVRSDRNEAERISAALRGAGFPMTMKAEQGAGVLSTSVIHRP